MEQSVVSPAAPRPVVSATPEQAVVSGSSVQVVVACVSEQVVAAPMTLEVVAVPVPVQEVGALGPGHDGFARVLVPASPAAKVGCVSAFRTGTDSTCRGRQDHGCGC